MFETEIAFTKVKLPYGWLGNMAPYPIMYENNPWKTSEALFQALRFADPEPTEQAELRACIREEIRCQSSPMAAKMIAKKNVNLMTTEPRSFADIQLMRNVLFLKLKFHQTLTVQLVESGDLTIVEDCTARQNESGLFWGAAKINGKWEGKNVLGNLWMEIRSNLQGMNGLSDL